jgi:hypothetical protein
MLRLQRSQRVVDVLAVGVAFDVVSPLWGCHNVGHVCVLASVSFLDTLQCFTSPVAFCTMLWQLLFEAMPNACTKGHRPWHSPHVLSGMIDRSIAPAASASAAAMCAHTCLTSLLTFSPHHTLTLPCP